MFLAKHFEEPLASPLRWSFGWYLWPIFSALADRLGGLVAVRELAAALGTAAVMAIYGFSRRLYGSAAGVGAAAVFALLGPAVMVSRIATRDAGAFFFFAVGLWAFGVPGRKMNSPAGCSPPYVCSVRSSANTSSRFIFRSWSSSPYGKAGARRFPSAFRWLPHRSSTSSATGPI